MNQIVIYKLSQITCNLEKPAKTTTEMFAKDTVQYEHYDMYNDYLKVIHHKMYQIHE